MKLQTLVAALLIVTLTLAPTRAHADCDDGGCSGLAVLYGGIIGGAALEGAAALGGLITMTGGAYDVTHHRYRAGWRIVNYVFAGLNFGAAFIWTVLAADGIAPPSLAFPVAVPHLAIGAADLTVALLSAKHSHDIVSVSVAPMVGRDISGHTLSGASLKMTF